MSTPAKNAATTPIPVQLSDTEFTAFILPHLTMPKRGPKCKLGYHRLFNLILWVLYTGMQWKCLGSVAKFDFWGKIRKADIRNSMAYKLQNSRKSKFATEPHFVLRYRQMRPEVARDALLATHGGLSLELCAVMCHISPMALYRLVCALGHHSLVTVLIRCGLALPVYFLADEKHSHCLKEKVYLPTIVQGRVIWHLGYTMEASAAAFTQSYQKFQHAALYKEPTYRVRGILTDGFDSTVKSMRTLFPGARLGNCLRHAINKLPKKLTAIGSPVRQALRSQFHTLRCRARQRKGVRVFALGQRLRHFADHVTHTAGVANGERVRRWFQDKKAGWYAVLADPQMPVTSTLLDQAHNAIERKLFAMKGFHPLGGSQQAFLRGLAHLYNLVPYQRRAKHGSHCGVEVEGGTLPTRDWFLNLQILTSGGFQCAPDTLHH